MRDVKRQRERRASRTITRVAAVTVLAGATLVVSPASPASAGGTCDFARWYPNGYGRQVFIPVDGDILNCSLWAPSYNNWAAVAIQDTLVKCYGQTSLKIDGDFGTATANGLKIAQHWENEVQDLNYAENGRYDYWPWMFHLLWPRYKIDQEGTGPTYVCRYYLSS